LLISTKLLKKLNPSTGKALWLDILNMMMIKLTGVLVIGGNTNGEHIIKDNIYYYSRIIFLKIKKGSFIPVVI
jgi:hypothetical protein